MEYRAGGTGGPHPGMDIFPVLSPRAKPYCGVKCSQGLYFPATIVYLKLGKENYVTELLRFCQGNIRYKNYIYRNRCQLNNIKSTKEMKS